jgi:hypothetical protein
MNLKIIYKASFRFESVFTINHFFIVSLCVVFFHLKTRDCYLFAVRLDFQIRRIQVHFGLVTLTGNVDLVVSVLC